MVKMIENGDLEEARCTAMAFPNYLRPSELMRVRCQDVIPPAGGPHHAGKAWSLILHPAETGVSSKTGIFDESMLMDNEFFAYLPLLAALLRNRGAPGSLLMRTTYYRWAAAFKKAASQVEVDAIGPPTLYTVRHGGATHDLFTGFRRLDEVKKRLRHRSDTSVARYSRPGRLAQVLAKLTPAVRRKAREAAGRIGAMLLGSSRGTPTVVRGVWR